MPWDIFFSIIANENPGPSDFSTSGSLIWKNKKVTIKGRSKCYFDEEGNKIYIKSYQTGIFIKETTKQTKLPLKTTCKRMLVKKQVKRSNLL